MPDRRSLFGAIALALILAACGSGGATDSSAGPDGTSKTAAAIGALHVITPSDGATVDTATVTLAGTAPAGATVTRDVSFGLDPHVDATDGTWTMEVELDEGANEIVLRLGDDGSTAQTLHITYESATAEATAESTEASEATAEPEPADVPTPEPTAKPATVEYKKLSNRAWAKLVKSPDRYLGNTYQLWACIWQFDAATGDDAFLAQASNKKRSYWFSDGENASFTGDADRLSDFVEDDMVVMNVTSLGSYSYDTQAGGNTTVPQFQVDKITRRGSCA